MKPPSEIESADFTDGTSEAILPSAIGRDIHLPRALGSLLKIEWLAIAALVFGLLLRFAARPNAPFWLDEAATGAILSQPDFSSFWREVYWEVSSPLYFLFMRPWASIFGLSNFALRAPSVIFSFVAPLCIAFAPIPRLSRADRLTWAAMLALWIPGIGFAQDARCYALVLLFATLQTLAFLDLLRATNFRNTAIWVTCAALTTATHYDAALLAFAQGFVFLALKRMEAIRQWPAMFIITPVVAMVAWQGPEMARFMAPETTWYQVQDANAILGDVLYLFGTPWWVLILPVLFYGSVAIGIARRKSPSAKMPSELFWAGAASVIAATILIYLATVKPIFTARYLAPFVPGVAILVIAILRTMARQAVDLVLGSLLMSATALCVVWLLLGAHHGDSVVEPLNYEKASEQLMKAGVQHVVFTWDNPNARAMHLEQIKAFGGFFFYRAGAPIDVIPIQVGAAEDPNQILLHAARSSNAAILWVYDTWVKGTTAKLHPPNISNLDPRWHCTNTGRKNFGIVRCIPETSSR